MEFSLQGFDEYALVDWGTSNLRVWIVDAQGVVQKQAFSSQGADQLLPDQFHGVIKNILLELGVRLEAGRKFPVIMCGMVGSRNGWVEANYLNVPVQCAQIPQHASYVEPAELDVYILPGLAFRSRETPDVMRGEETQILGLHMQNPDFHGLICMPGTHSKWVFMRQGIVESFHTAMTGELFSLLSKQSVLRHVIGDDYSFSPDSALFKTGVMAGYHHPERVIHDLFSIRAAGLLFSSLGAEASARLSGLLIGAEISCFSKDYPPDKNRALIATGRMLLLYKQAFEYTNIIADLYDADSLVQRGLHFASRQIFSEKEAVF